MKPFLASRQFVIAAVMATSVLALGIGQRALESSANAQGATVQSPVFEVDPAWPKIPPKWKLGDPSSIAFDAQDNVWVLHRPRTLKGADLAMAAPPVIVFSGSGDFIKAWGGDGAGYDWPQREHGIHIDYKGYVWLGGNNCPESGHALLKQVADDALLKFTQDGKFIAHWDNFGRPSGCPRTKLSSGSSQGYRWCMPMSRRRRPAMPTRTRVPAGPEDFASSVTRSSDVPRVLIDPLNY